MKAISTQGHQSNRANARRQYRLVVELDELDLAIMRHLVEDARTPNAVIGRNVGLTGPAVSARARRLETNAIIRGYHAHIDHAALGKSLLAIVRIITRPTPDEAVFTQFVHAEPRIVECFDVDGEDSYFLRVRCSSPPDLQDLLLKLRSLPVVVRTITNIVLKPIKEER